MAVKKGLMLFITAAIVLIIILAFTIYVHFGKQQIYDEALDYLMVNQEYYKSDMKSITVEHSIPARFLAQRPFPSMMMAICRGRFWKSTRTSASLLFF